MFSLLVTGCSLLVARCLWEWLLATKNALLVALSLWWAVPTLQKYTDMKWFVIRRVGIAHRKVAKTMIKDNIIYHLSSNHPATSNQ
jgi:hypothetical protein